MKPTTRAYLCIAAGWVLMVCYSILLVSAVESTINLSGITLPDQNLRQMIIFLYGLAVVSFLGGSQIPAVFLKKKSFIVQFGFSATFGFMLLLITILSRTTLRPLNETVLKPFFLEYPIIAVEYLSIPYLFMIFIDFYLSGRLSAFSWRYFGQSLTGTFIHPRRTLEEVSCHQTTLLSLVCVILVSATWIVRTVAFSLADFIPSRRFFVPFSVSESLGLGLITTLTIPAMLLLWLLVSALLHFVARQLGGTGSYPNLASMLGFAFLPSLIMIVADLFEMGLQAGNLAVPSEIFLILGFGILVLWPLILVTLAIQISEGLPRRSASLTAIIAFLPLFIPFTQALL